MDDFLYKQNKMNFCFVTRAAFCKVGEEWNRNVWNPRDNPTGYHALYYRTDKGNGRAILHTVNGEIELLPGKIYFIPAYSVLHSEISGEMEKYYIHFQSDLFDFGLYSNHKDYEWIMADRLTKNLFDVVIENFNINTLSSQHKVCGAMELLLADFMENIAIQPCDFEKFKCVLQYIDEHFREKIPLKNLSKMMNISTVYFGNIFKTAFHISPKQYILGKRLYESQRLLAKTDLSVHEIAETVGFENENYFSEFFSSKVGLPALKFREYSRGK